MTGVLTTSLSLNGRVRVGEQTIGPALAAEYDLAHLRYWPQLYIVSTTGIQPGGSLRIEIAVRGHASAKNGLGTLTVAPPAVAQAIHARETLYEALAMLVMAAATAMAGGLGLAVRDFRSPAGRLLRVVSWIALLASMRMATNFVTQPPIAVPAWTGFNLVLLAAIAAAVCLTMGMYLQPARRGMLRWFLASLILLAAGLITLPAQQMFLWTEAWFTVITLFGALMFFWLLLRVIRSRDTLGWIVAGPVLGIVILGAHDLLLHLSERSMWAGYLQRWSVPGLLILMIGLLVRQMTAQRKTEAALALETSRREELLRDLHDGIGSRLVALLFHARRSSQSPQLGEEIEAMQRELQLIQGAVRAVPTTLTTLIADLRHLYARIGGGALPITWQISEADLDVTLTAQQAMTTGRVFEEAIANAIKHAHPRRITVGLSAATAPWLAVLSIHDDGGGSYLPDRGHGLTNMRLRAERAGLLLQFEQTDSGLGGKAVKLLFPASNQRRPVRSWTRIGQHLWGRRQN